MFNKRILTILLLGFSSGLPLALTGATLQAWFTESNVSLMTIGMLSLVGVPYVWKFVWAPIMDRYIPPFFGKRRGWILVTQLGLSLTLFLLANLNPGETPKLIGWLALIIAFLSASQDIAYNAYTTDVLLPTERGLGAASTVLGYRIAMLISGGLALVLADHFGWRITYEVMALLMAFATLVTYLGPEAKPVDSPHHIKQVFFEAFNNLLRRDGIVIILLFVVFYKFGDALALSLMSNFLLHGVGFSLTDVGIVFKTAGLFAIIFGGFVGGALLTRMNLYRGLLFFGLAQAFSNLTFMILAYTGKNYLIMVSTIFIESFCSGLSTAALVAFLMSLCDHRFTATQFASLTALTAVPRVFLGPVAALMVEHLGWINFYFWSFVLCFPGIMLLNMLRHKVRFNAEVVEY